MLAASALLFWPYSALEVNGELDSAHETFPGGQPFEWVLVGQEQTASELVLKFRSDDVRAPFKRVDNVRITKPLFIAQDAKGDGVSRLQQVADSRYELTIAFPLHELEGTEKVEVSFKTGCEALKYYGLSGSPMFNSGRWPTTIEVQR